MMVETNFCEEDFFEQMTFEKSKKNFLQIFKLSKDYLTLAELRMYVYSR